jgi:hypothetical protein
VQPPAQARRARLRAEHRDRRRLFERYISSTDFIQQYIFPGGCLPCPREFRAQAAPQGLEVVDEFAFGADYAETLRRWRDAFLAAKARSCNSVLMKGSSAYGSSTSPTARRPSTWPTSTWCSTRCKSAERNAAGACLLAGLAPRPARGAGSGQLTASARLSVFGFEVYDARLWAHVGAGDARRSCWQEPRQ